MSKQFHSSRELGNALIQVAKETDGVGLVESFPTLAAIPAGFNGTAQVGTQLYVGDGESLVAINQIQTIGLVASNCRVGVFNSAGAWKTDQRTVHVAAENLTKIKVIHANWDSFGGNDTASGGTLLIESVIEYPVNTFTRITYSGSNTQLLQSGGESTPDWAYVSIPKGAIFGVRAYAICSSNLSSAASWYASYNGYMSEGGNNSLTSVTNQVVSTSATYAPGGVVVPVIAIVGYTSNKSYLLSGDSITAGSSGDAADAQYKKGIYERATNYPCINTGLGGESITNGAMTRFSKRGALARYCTNVHIAYGTNDFVGGNAAATILSAINSYLTTYAANKVVSVSTIIPFSTGTFVATGGTGQTAHANEAVRVATNNLILNGGILVPHTVVDTYTPFADSYSSAFWKGFASPNQITTDGTHPSHIGCIYLASNINLPV